MSPSPPKAPDLPGDRQPGSRSPISLPPSAPAPASPMGRGWWMAALLGLGGALLMPGCYVGHSRVSAPADFLISIPAANLKVDAGTSGILQVQVDRQQGYQGAIHCIAANLPQGVTLQGSIPAGAGLGYVQITVATEVPPATYPDLGLTGTSGRLSHRALFTLTVGQGKSATSSARLQAVGGPQAGDAGRLSNHVLIGEGTRAGEATSSDQYLLNRSGFVPPIGDPDGNARPKGPMPLPHP